MSSEIATTSPTLEKSHNYAVASRATHDLAKDVFKIDVTDAQQELWRSTYAAMYHLDDILDQDLPRDERHSEFERNLDFIKTGECDEDLTIMQRKVMTDLRESLATAAPHRTEEFTKIARSIMLFGERLRAATSVRVLGLLAL